jgi:hypothetical protein
MGSYHIASLVSPNGVSWELPFETYSKCIDEAAFTGGLSSNPSETKEAHIPINYYA